ncbi:two-component sensor histidine kinase [bacterium]|nr:two-component sensor histidine kinase [bacterium]
MKNNGYKRLHKYIILSMVLAPVMIYVGALAIGYIYFANSLESSTESIMERVIKDHRQMIESFLEERKGDLTFLQDTYTYDELTNNQILAQILKQLQKKSPAFIDLGIFDNNGLHVAYQGPYDLTGRQYKKEGWFREVIEQGYYISDVFLGFRKVPHFVIAVVMNSEKRWVIRATIDTYLFNTLVEHISIGKTGEAYIVNAKGMLQTQRRSGGALMEVDEMNGGMPKYHEGIKVFMQSGINKEEFLTATTWLNNRSWMLVVRQDKQDAFQSLHSASYIIILLSIVGILIIIVVSFFLSTSIIRRMGEVNAEKDQLQYQLIRAGGLAELGEMATGFAHEINNPLQIIKNEQTLIRMNLSELYEEGQVNNSEVVAELEDSLNQIGIQIDRCARITQAILKFGRKSEAEIKTISLKEFIPQITVMIEKKAAVHGIEFYYQLSRGIQTIKGDPSQLQQVILNLLNNAIDAVIEKHSATGGKIEFFIRPDGKGNISFVVTDNGIGITQENIDKVFTPFFTTKPVGKGTGLGLSVCFGIIQKMGGRMEVTSNPNEGTTFNVLLPNDKVN